MAIGDRSTHHAAIGDGGPAVVSVDESASGIEITSTEDIDHDAWFAGTFRVPPSIVWTDPVIAGLANRIPGLWSFCDGSVFDGIVTSVIGQSISLASASAVQKRLCGLFSVGSEVGGRVFLPLPTANQLAESSPEILRSTGMTTRRAVALTVIAQEFLAGNLPSELDIAHDIAGAERALIALPQVGKWTVASSLLWGIGLPDVYPPNDVALLRAARLAYDDDAMTMKDLEKLSDGWRPGRAIAARLLWTSMLGLAW